MENEELNNGEEYTKEDFFVDLYNGLGHMTEEEKQTVFDILTEDEMKEFREFVKTQAAAKKIEEEEEPVVLRPYPSRRARWGRAFTEAALADYNAMMDGVHERNSRGKN